MERNDQPAAVSRRSFLGSVGSAIGSAAFASTLVRGADGVRTCHYRPRVRRIIHLCLEDEEGVVTESVGQGDDRAVEVLPA